LARAKTRLRTNHCSVGSVRRIHVRRGRGTVVGQRPSAGAIRRRGFPVRLVVGRR
jgi:beta-lactam-binding protein with PASTA domain